MFGSEVASQLVAFGTPGGVRSGACHVNAAIRETVDLFGSRIPETTTIVFELEEDLPPVWISPIRLRQLLMNLLLNAIGSFRGGVGTVTFGTTVRRLAPTLTIDTRTETRPFGEYVEVVIRDNGSGIPDEVLSHVMSPFVTTTGGSGMGLAVVRETLLEAGGGIDVESQLNVGTTFRVHLPVRR